MTTADTPRAGAGWLFWVVVAIAILWNGFGAFDYTMSHVSGDAYFRSAGMSEAQIAALRSYPSWMHAVWAIGVWGSAVGSILLLLRMKWALHAFGVSLLGAVGNLAYAALERSGGLVLPAVIIAACLFFIWYSWAMTKRGVLR